jgi:hypothetical protein
MKQSTLGNFFTKPAAVKGAEKPTAACQAKKSENGVLKDVNTDERKRVREVSLEFLPASPERPAHLRNASSSRSHSYMNFWMM